MLFASNLDGALVGDRETTELLQQELRKLRSTNKIVYVTGRSFEDYRALRNEFDLDEPDYLCYNTGTEICSIPGHADKEWRNYISEGWNAGRIQTICEHFPALILQPQQFAFKLGYYIYPEDAEINLPALRTKLDEYGIKCWVFYSAEWFLDIIPFRAGKRRSVEFIMKRLGLQYDQVITVGNFGSDFWMLNQEWRSIITANADKDILAHKYDKNTYKSQAPGPAGVLEGLKHYGVIS